MTYDVLKNRLTNGVPYMAQTAADRITNAADNLEITVEERDELLALAEAHGMHPEDTTEGRLAACEAAILDIGIMLSDLLGGAAV